METGLAQTLVENLNPFTKEEEEEATMEVNPWM